MFSQSRIITRAQAVLARYRASHRSIFYTTYRASDRIIYEAQLEALDKKEQNGGDNEKIILGLFLLIYLQVEVSDENVQGAVSDALRSAFGMRSLRVGEVSSGSRLGQALGECEFTLHDEKTIKLSEIAFHYRHIASHPYVAVLASEAVQEAFLWFKSQRIVVNNESIKFFTLDQKRWVYNDSFLCAMIDVHARANAEKIFEDTQADQATGVLTGSPIGKEIINGFLQIIENTVMYLAEITQAMSLLYPEYTESRDQWLCMKLVFLVVLDTVVGALREVRRKCNFSLDHANEFFQNIRSKLFLGEVYVESRWPRYNHLRILFFNTPEVKKLLLKNMASSTIEFCKEVFGSIEILPATMPYHTFIQYVQSSDKDKLLLKGFLNSALVVPEKIAKTSKAAEALIAYRRSRSVIKIRAADRAFYEAQLERIVQQEEDGFAVTDYIVAGLFLLTVLSIQAGSESGFLVSMWRNGPAAIFDAGFDDEATGSRLEQVLGRFEFSVPGEMESAALSRLAIACTTPYSPDHLVAFSSTSMQDVFLSMKNEAIFVNEKKFTFFTPSEKELVYRHSYLCAMQDISARAIEENIFPTSSVEENIVRGFFAIVENAIKNLAQLADIVASVFPELAGEEYKLLRAKSVCFLVLNRIYFALELTGISHIQLFLERTLMQFFGQKLFPQHPREQAFCLSSQFFTASSTILFEHIDLEVSTLLLDQRKPDISLAAWIKTYDFSMTFRDTCLLENFLANHTPIVGDTTRGACEATIEL